MRTNDHFGHLSFVLLLFIMNKFRLSAYLCTPSGTQKRGYACFCLNLSIPKHFSYPLEVGDVKKLWTIKSELNEIKSKALPGVLF